jgi:response regulator NasT
MHKAYRVAIADDNPIDLLRLRETLLNAGHTVVLEERTGDEFFRHCLAASPDLIITDVQRSGLDELKTAQAIFGDRKLPIIVVSDVDVDCFLDHMDAYRPMAFLSKPVRENELRAAVVVAIQCFNELQSFRAEASSTRQALEDRKLIERAKGILMRQRSFDEATAFKCLQNLARRHRQKLIDVAKCIILADKALCACSEHNHA